MKCQFTRNLKKHKLQTSKKHQITYERAFYSSTFNPRKKIYYAEKIPVDYTVTMLADKYKWNGRSLSLNSRPTALCTLDK